MVATDTAFVPFEFKQGDKYVGFDIDLWAAVAKELKLDYTLKPMDFGGIIPALQTKTSIWRWPASPSPMSAKSHRLLRRLLQERPAGDGQRRQQQREKHRRSERQSGGGEERHRLGGLRQAAHQNQDLRQFPNIDNAYMELGTKRADAVLHDTPNILYFIKTAGAGKFKTVGDSLEAQQYGIAFPKGSDELREKVNGALKTLRANGTYNGSTRSGSAPNLSKL